MHDVMGCAYVFDVVVVRALAYFELLVGVVGAVGME